MWKKLLEDLWVPAPSLSETLDFTKVLRNLSGSCPLTENRWQGGGGSAPSTRTR